MNTFKVRNNKSKKLQKNTNNKHPNSPFIMGKKMRTPTTSVRKPVNRKNIRIAGLMMKKSELQREMNIINGAIKKLKA
jgi:hypothetical protein|tara:strand:+ start:818 stop:1051 length:234 start_codon:yes stop_codon:yes gene_type:complete